MWNMVVNPVFTTITKLKAHLLTFVTGGIFLDINGTVSDIGIYADSTLDYVVVTNADPNVCKEIQRLCTSRPVVHVLNIDVTTIHGIIQLQIMLSRQKVQMVFWRFHKDVEDLDRAFRILNGLMEEQRTIHVVIPDRDLFFQYRKTKRIGTNATNIAFLDRGYECSTYPPQLTMTDLLIHMSKKFNYTHTERLSHTAAFHGINLLPCEKDLAHVHSVVCMTSKVRT